MRSRDGSALRVLQVITDTARRGAQVFGVDLAAELDRRGHVVRTLALADAGGSDPLPVAALGRRRLAVPTLRRLRRAVHGADVVVAHGSSTLPACAAVTLATGRPFVYRSIGDIAFWTTTASRRVRTAAALHRAAAVIALWPDAVDGLVHGLGVEASRVHVIPNAVPSWRWPPVTPAERAAARGSFALPAAASVLVFVGALAPEKAVDTAIAAVAARPHVHLLVVGSGPLRSELEALAERVAPRRVTFLGRTDPRPAVAAADAIVLPSRSEGLPGVLIEAGLAGLPAIASDVGGVREVVVPGHTGALVRPGDATALASAIDDVVAHREVLGPAARRRCLDRFEIGSVAAQWDIVLQQVAGDVRPRLSRRTGGR